MKQRCYYEEHSAYPRYGGRGIKICPEWLNDFQEFQTWAFENGYADDLTIDRIDNDQGYFPENCRWVTRMAQMHNLRGNVLDMAKADAIREAYAQGGISMRALAQRYGTTASNVHGVIHRTKWTE